MNCEKDFENILYEIQDGILYLTLNRPEARNALTPAMWRDIRSAVEMARTDDSIKAVIVSGAGDKALAGGADIREIHDRDYLQMLHGTSSAALKELEDLYKPVICAINGYALGGGCELAMACDIRIATGRSRFGQPETGLSIIPGAGGTQRLVRLIGVGRAKELIYTGRIITASEAKDIGLVNQVTEDSREAVMNAAVEIPVYYEKRARGHYYGKDGCQRRNGYRYQHRTSVRANRTDSSFQHRGSYGRNRCFHGKKGGRL